MIGYFGDCDEFLKKMNFQRGLTVLEANCVPWS